MQVQRAPRLSSHVYWRTHQTLFTLGTLLALVGAILSVVLPIPNPLWIVAFPLGGGLLLSASFAAPLLMTLPPIARYAFVLFLLGAWSIFLAALSVFVIASSLPYTFFVKFSVVGAALLCVACVPFSLSSGGLLHVTKSVAISGGCLCLLAATAVGNTDKVHVNHVLSVAAFAALFVGSLLHWI